MREREKEQANKWTNKKTKKKKRGENEINLII